MEKHDPAVRLTLVFKTFNKNAKISKHKTKHKPKTKQKQLLHQDLKQVNGFTKPGFGRSSGLQRCCTTKTESEKQEP